jgi:hypothetical protein
MSAFKKLSLVGVVGLTGAAFPIACATEGGSEPIEPTPEGDSGYVVGPSPEAGADVTTEGRDAAAIVEAGACSTSRLCTTSVPFDTRTNITSIRGSGPSDIWAVGTNRSAFHYDGRVWEQSNVPEVETSPFTLRSVFVDRPDDVWISDGPTVRHATGWKGAGNTEWSTVDLAEGFTPYGIDGRDGVVFVACAGAGAGSLAKLDQASGGAGPVEFLGDTSIGPGFETVTFTRADEAWGHIFAGGYVNTGWMLGGIVRISRAAPGSGAPAWRLERYDSRMERPLYGVWGNDEAIWLVGEAGALRRITRDAVSTTKTFEIVEGPVATTLRAVYGFSSNDIWAVGDESTVLHWDGHAWTKLTTPLDTMPDKPRLMAVWGSSKNDIWIGGNGVMLHFEGSAP